MSKLLAIGSDYEVFVRRIDSDQIVSAIPLIGEGKDRRIQLETCEIHHDNVLAEVNIIPSSSKAEFFSTVKSSLDELASFLNTTGHTYVVTDSVIMSAKELRHVDACEFGCSEDYDIIRGVSNIAPSAILAGNLRTAGGHVHVSYTFKTRNEYRTTALLLSTIISLGTTIMGDSRTRRKLYGRAGSVRLKEYGVEVRTPSNIWLANGEWINWIYSAIQAICRMSASLKLISVVENLLEHIKEAIDTCDVATCRGIFKRLEGISGITAPISAESIKDVAFARMTAKLSRPTKRRVPHCTEYILDKLYEVAVDDDVVVVDDMEDF